MSPEQAAAEWLRDKRAMEEYRSEPLQFELFDPDEMGQSREDAIREAMEEAFSDE